jgi:dihydrolipoamide dehydrogenase
VIIEGGAYGTTCARVGCMPSKLLIAAAEAAHAIDRAPGFGVHVDGTVRVDGREVMARVQRERDRFVGFVCAASRAFPRRPHPRLREVRRSRTRSRSSGQRIEARAIVIATGSRPAIPPILQDLGDASS